MMNEELKDECIEFLNENYSKSDSYVGLVGCVVVHYHKKGIRIIEEIDVERIVKDWKKSNNQITLTPKQIKQLMDLVKDYPSVEWYTITSRNDSGIGASITVQYSTQRLMTPNATQDITDYESW